MSDEQFSLLDNSDYEAIMAEMRMNGKKIVDETDREEIAKEIAEEMRAEREAEATYEERKNEWRAKTGGSQVKATAQIFLSYAREDEEKVEKLYQKLSAAGFKPWMDKKDILPGERWQSSTRQAIRGSHFFLACLSANSVTKRGYLQKEIKKGLDIWDEMLEDDIYLIPVRLEACEVPERLRDVQWVDLFERNGWTRLVKAIQVGMERRA